MKKGVAARLSMLTSRRLERTYLLRGLDRVLYNAAPCWREGTFVQEQEDSGSLVLHVDGIPSTSALNDAIQTLDQKAERFRLAISKRTECPLTLTLEKSEEPNFDPPGILRARDRIRIFDSAKCTVLPRDPPTEIEQVPEGSARWILTLTEARNFSAHPDEVLKRIYLLIEELQDEYAHHLSEEQRAAQSEVKWVRDFVSHSTCTSQSVCALVAAHLPSAVVCTQPLKVRFDRTDIEHKNFVGKYDSMARSIARTLLNAAIAALP
jgi:hypothetical protein